MRKVVFEGILVVYGSREKEKVIEGKVFSIYSDIYRKG